MSAPVAVGDGVVGPLDPARDGEAAAILAACTDEGTPERGREALAAARDDPDTALYGLTVQDELVAVYALRKTGLSLEVTLLAVAEPHRGRGYGRACLTDALRRAGKRPLVVETDDDALGFYQAVGFKLVGKRRHPSGAVRYRLGWHAPRGPHPAQRAPALSRPRERAGDMPGSRARDAEGSEDAGPGSEGRP